MKMVADELRDKKISDTNICFIDLDKYGYKNIKTSEALEKIIFDLRPKKGIVYLFIDEIQNVKGFEEVLNSFRLMDRYSIFITGSNSYLLSGELVTKLTGRYLEFEFLTLGFDEYLSMKKFYKKSIDENKLVELNNYILEGGFLRALFLDGIKEKRTYVRGVINEIFEKDIKKNNKIRSVQAFEMVRNYIINNFGATISISSIKKELSKNNYNIKNETIKRNIEILKYAKLIYECDRFDMKSKKIFKGEKNTIWLI